jgi:Zn2+/Cd2+-exporting ATPase
MSRLAPAGRVRLCRQTLAVLRQNIVFSLLLKAVFMVLVLGGAATLWMAVFADVGASLIVILNGMRLLRTEATVPRAAHPLTLP